jgi:ABC-type transporter Mla maintaining outer membrane lipid asymmetry ATPase subunit MlaF
METKQSEITVGLDAQNKVESTYIVEIKNLSKSFGENHVLKDITINIKKGENLVVLGKSAAENLY